MKYIFISFVLSLSVLVSACGDFLEEESQSEVIPESASDFSELLLGSGYPTTSSKGGPDFSFIAMMDDDCSFFLNFLNWDGTADYFVESSTAVTYYPIYTWQPSLADYDGYGNAINESPSSTVYAQFYERILGCNAVLDYIDKAVGGQEKINRVKAEALAVRALLYFQLVNIYGEPYNYNKDALGVPAKLTADLADEPIGRATVQYIYEEIIVKGLVEAALLMDPLEIVRQNYRINQPAIHILLSRVYLYMERYQDCIKEVENALKQGAVLLDMVNSLGTIATGTSYNPISYDNPEVEWLFGACVIPGGNYDAFNPATSEEFQALWDKVNDQRYLAFALAPGNSDNVVYISKPTSNYDLGQSVRTAEAYLNRMEAYALSGEDQLALSELNAFRKKRIIGYSDQNYSGQELLSQIRLERRKELCYEGHRWFDLRRYGMPAIKHQYKYEKGGALYEFVLEEKDPMYTVPFPTSLFEKNTLLKQNDSRNESERQGNIID